MSRAPTPRFRLPLERLRRAAPLPFVAVSAILVLLIIFTPIFLSTGPSPLLAQGVLTVDRVGSENWTKFYVMALDPHAVRYQSVSIAIGVGFTWNGTCPSTPVHWSTVSQNWTLSLRANTTANPVVVNATAVYPSASGPDVYAGEFAFYLSDAAGPNPQLHIVACTQTTPGVTVPSSSVAIAQLPTSFALVDYGSGGPP